MNSAQPALPYTPPAIKSEQELKDLCKTEAFEVSNPDDTDPCASIKKLTAQTASITLIQDKQQTLTEDKDNTYGVEGLALSGAIVLALIMQYRGKISSSMRNWVKQKQHGSNYYSHGGTGVHYSELVPTMNMVKYSEGKTVLTEKAKEVIEKDLRNSMDTKNKKQGYDDLFVTFSLLTRTHEVDTFSINQLRIIILEEILRDENKKVKLILLEKAVGILKYLKLPINKKEIPESLDISVRQELTELLEIIFALEVYIESSTPTQFPAAPVAHDTDSSEGKA